MKDFEGKTVLVTVAGGFIGSHLIERLAELNAKVRALMHHSAFSLPLSFWKKILHAYHPQ